MSDFSAFISFKAVCNNLLGTFPEFSAFQYNKIIDSDLFS